MSFRPANRSDEDFFYYWRRRDEQAGARGGWYQGRSTTRDAHKQWFADRLHTARLLVWERADGPMGVARIDTNGEVAFSTEPQWAPRMLEELLWFADIYGGRLKATVDVGDAARHRALELAGFVEFPARFYCYRPEEDAA